MTVRLNDTFANDQLDAFDATFDNGTLEFRSGAQPASANSAATGTLIASMALPANSFAAAASRQKAKSGTWEDPSADNAGTIGWARMKNAADTRRVDFSVTATGGGGDIEVDNTVVVAGQDIIVTALTLAY